MVLELGQGKLHAHYERSNSAKRGMSGHYPIRLYVPLESDRMQVPKTLVSFRSFIAHSVLCKTEARRGGMISPHRYRRKMRRWTGEICQFLARSLVEIQLRTHPTGAWLDDKVAGVERLARGWVLVEDIANKSIALAID